MATTAFTKPRVVSCEEWMEARKALLAKEKELTRAKDALTAERRQLPMVRIDKAYTFEGPRGRVSLADLFGDRSQLIINHFMFGPDWEEGCIGCSFAADHINGGLAHLLQRDLNYVAVSRAPYAKIAAFKERMGWDIEWVSSFESDFNFDFSVSFPKEAEASGEIYYNYAVQPFYNDEMSGLSVFLKDDDGTVYHTYSTFGRGAEDTLPSYFLIDLTPRGRDENGPTGSLADWVKLHDRYGAADGAPDCHGNAGAA